MKTLKELSNCEEFGKASGQMLKKILRQSAIEDIKELQKFQMHHLKETHKVNWENIGFFDACGECNFIMGKIEYIKQKFNITEDDLKCL